MPDASDVASSGCMELANKELGHCPVQGRHVQGYDGDAARQRLAVALHAWRRQHGCTCWTTCRLQTTLSSFPGQSKLLHGFALVVRAGK